MPGLRPLSVLALSLAACQPVPPEPAAPQPIAAPAADSAAPGPVGAPEPGSAQLSGRPFFCAPLQPLPQPPPYCTRSIGQVDCWVRPPLTLPPRPGVADGRSSLTPAQAAQRAQCWPGFL